MKKIYTLILSLMFSCTLNAQQNNICHFIEIPDLGVVYGIDEPSITENAEMTSLRANAAFQLGSQSKDKIFKTIVATKEWPGQLNDFHQNDNGQIHVQCLPCSTCVCFETGRAIKRQILIEFEQGTISSSDVAIVSPGADVICQIQLRGNIERIEQVTDKFIPLPGWGSVQIFYGVPRVQEFGAPGNYIVDCFPQPSMCAKFVW